ncbi:UNVERIFIED_CONTAM: hypothetical protein Slati_1979900 [Sesamum latifolium]|uniref:Uncharacterized protein n=1 Tax=Sesamum latifolium TaxID=2727402 RepID=A0AAW2WLA2_9LAMI
MPSGAKKRKAAKKKKGNLSNNHPNPSSASAHSHGSAEGHGLKYIDVEFVLMPEVSGSGDEDVKHQDDKGSDVGEVSSPASQDHHRHETILTEGEEEEIEKEGNLSSPPSVGELKTDSGQVQKALESVVRVEREIKIDDELGHRDETFEHDESTTKSYDGGSSGRSSSSSSSSSSDDESHGIKNSEAAMDISSVVDSAKEADSLSAMSADSIFSALTKEARDSVAEKISVLGEQVGVDMSSPTNITVAPYVVESVAQENGGKKLSSVEDKVGTSMACVYDALERKEEAIVQSVQATATVSDPKECVTQETDDRLTLPYNAPSAPADNGAEHKKDSGVTQPLLVPSPHPVHRTSWKSCCGLFEVFSGSGA